VVRVAFVYANPRQPLVALIERGEAPDTSLLGQNHFAGTGLDARILDSRARRVRRGAGLSHRATWILRELTIPFEARSFDLVVTPLGSLLPLVARLHRRPKVVLVNVNLCTALERLTGAAHAMMARSVRAANTVVCLARSQRDRLLEQVGIDAERVVVIPLGVDERFFSPRRVGPESERRVVAVGRDLGRDYGTFARAMRLVDAPGTIVASRRNLVGVDLPANVAVELDVSPARLRELYALASCVVIPTHSAEFRLGADCSGQTVLLDAMAMGRAAVITQRPTLAEYLDDGRTALTVPPADHVALADAISALRDDERRRSTIEAAARRRVEREHTTRRFAERLLPVLQAAACDR
jgi:glycosyltransferase involved in cell wall biosynthesis